MNPTTPAPTTGEALKIARDALKLAMEICDAVPNRAHKSGTAEWRVLGSLVNYQDDGTHGYAVIKAALAATEAPSTPSGADNELKQVYDLLGVGAQARSIGTLTTSLRNMMRFADMLHAVEREFFTVPGEPDEDFPGEEPGDDCLVNCWGSTVEQYVEQFRAALAQRASAPDEQEPVYQWRDHKSDVWSDCTKDAFDATQRNPVFVCRTLYTRPAPVAASTAEPQSITITLRQAHNLVKFFGGHDTYVTVTPPRPDWGVMAPGLYAYCTEYPSEGSDYLGETEIDDLLTATSTEGAAARRALMTDLAGSIPGVIASTAEPVGSIDDLKHSFRALLMDNTSLSARRRDMLVTALIIFAEAHFARQAAPGGGEGLDAEQLKTIRFAADALEGRDYEYTVGELRAILAQQGGGK